MREQTAHHTYVIQKRASLPVPQYYQEAPPASRHRAGHHPGMHPEDAPYNTRTRYRPPLDDTKYATEDDEEYIYPHRMRSSVIVRRQPYTQVEPVTQTGEWEQQPQPYRGKHPVFYLGVSMLIVLVFIAGSILIPPAVQKWSDDRTYGYPRTFQTDANVGHGGLSHFIVVNRHGTIEMLELPADPTKTKPQLYIITSFKGDGADLIPATATFTDLNGDGKPDMQVTVFNGSIPTIWILYNDGQTFKPRL